MARMMKNLVVLYSEALLLYYVLALFISVELFEATFVNVTWWIIAGVSGYVLNAIIIPRLHDGIVVVLNIVFLTIIIWQNWRLTVPENAYFIGFFLSMAVLFVFARSASFVFKEPTRLQLLQRFEFSIFMYVVLTFVFSINDWGNEVFHLSFIFAILACLFGLILILQDAEDSNEKQQQVAIHKVGNPRSFFGVMGLFLIIAFVISSILFLPSFREVMRTLTFTSLAGAVWVFDQIGAVFTWIFSKLPKVGSRALPGTEHDEELPPEDFGEEVTSSIPLEWITFGVAFVVILIVAIIFTYFLKHWRAPEKKQMHAEKRENVSWIKVFLKNLRKWVQTLRYKWRSSFARYYKSSVYWYFSRIEKWAAKNGLVRHPSETSKEFITKVVKELHQEDVSIENLQMIEDQLYMLNDDYQALYYGEKVSNKDVDVYEKLLQQLKEIGLNSYKK